MPTVDFVVYSKAINRLRAEEQLMMFEAVSIPNMEEKHRKSIYREYKKTVDADNIKINTMDEVVRFLTNGK